MPEAERCAGDHGRACRAPPPSRPRRERFRQRGRSERGRHGRSNLPSQLTQATDAQTTEVATLTALDRIGPCAAELQRDGCPRRGPAATQAAPPPPAASNARRAVAAAIAQETEQATLDASDLSAAKKAPAAPPSTETPAPTGRPSDPVSSPRAPADSASVSEIRAEAVAPQNQAAAPAAPERAEQSGNPPAAGSPRAQTPDSSTRR